MSNADERGPHPMSAQATVVYADPSPKGLAAMLGGLIEENLARDPARRRLLKRAVFAVEAPDAEVAVTLHVDPKQIRVSQGADGSATIRVRADSARLLAIAGAPLRFGFPDVFRADGRRVIADIIARRIRIGGLLRHPVSAARLTRLLSAR